MTKSSVSAVNHSKSDRLLFSMKLNAHYNTLWNQSIQQFKAGQFEYDSLINSEDDTRYGITLLARPSVQVKQNILDILKKIKSVAPHQYYYPKSDLHLTVLSIISCYPDFSLDKINPTEYSSVINSAVDSISPFYIKFSGLTASPSCILIQGFPEGNQLHKLRNNLRKKFKHSKLQHSIDKRYQLQTAHITAIRFKQPFSEEKAFVQTLTDLKETNFGSCLIEELELVGNDWYQQKEKVKLIDKFNLTNIK